MSVRELIRSDAVRYIGSHTPIGLRELHAIWLYSPGFRFMFWFRIAQGFRAGGRDKRRGWRRLAFWAAHHVLHWYGYRFGFDIPISCELGPGFKLGHYGGVVFNAAVRVGENCTVSHGVTVGNIPRGPKQGNPVLGDRVWLGTGCAVLGGIRVGNDSLVAPNAVVFQNVPESAIVVGPAARVASADPEKGSRGYALRLWTA